MAAASVGSVVDVTQLLCRERAAAFGIAIESLAAGGRVSSVLRPPLAGQAG